MNKIQLLLLIVISVLSCNKVKKEKLEYYSTGELFRITQYNNPKDTTDIKRINYNKDGSVYSEINMKDGKRHGKALEWDERGDLKYDYNYFNGKSEGLQKVFSAGCLILKELRINDKSVCFDKYFYNDSTGEKLIQRCSSFPDSGYSVINGEAYIDSLGNVKSNISHIPYTYSVDTVEFGKSVSVGIKFYRLKEVRGADEFKFLLGDFDEHGEFIDSLLVKTFTSVHDTLVYYYTPPKKGENIIKGKIELMDQGEKKSFVYFHVIYAK